MVTWISAAQGMGIETVICLMESKKIDRWYGHLEPGGLLGRYKESGLRVCHIEAEDRKRVSLEVKDNAWRAFTLARRSAVVVQDSGGVDRSGAVAKYIRKQIDLTGAKTGAESEVGRRAR